MEEERQFSIVSVTDDEGLRVLPAFTSETALLRWRPEGARFMALQARVVLDLLSSGNWDRMVVDTESDTAFAVTPAEAGELLGP